MNDTIHWDERFNDLQAFINGVAEKLEEGNLRNCFEAMAKSDGVLETKAAKEHLNKVENYWINSDGKADFFLIVNALLEDQEQESQIRGALDEDLL